MKVGNAIVATIVLLLSIHSAHALDPTQPFNSYIQTHFTTADGLPGQIINDIVQSQDGFLWMTYGGFYLGRFDGRNFTTLPVNRTDALALAPNGDLWAG